MGGRAAVFRPPKALGSLPPPAGAPDRTTSPACTPPGPHSKVPQYNIVGLVLPRGRCATRCATLGPWRSRALCNTPSYPLGQTRAHVCAVLAFLAACTRADGRLPRSASTSCRNQMPYPETSISRIILFRKRNKCMFSYERPRQRGFIFVHLSFRRRKSRNLAEGDGRSSPSATSRNV